MKPEDKNMVEDRRRATEIRVAYSTRNGPGGVPCVSYGKSNQLGELSTL